MEQEARPPTPFEREIAEVAAFDFRSLLRPVIPTVELVLAAPGALPHEIEARITAPASRADWIIDALNYSLVGDARWRRAETYRDAGDHGHLPEREPLPLGRDGIPTRSGR